MSVSQIMGLYSCLQFASMQCTCAILPSVACPALQHFSTFSHKWQRFSERRYWTQNVCFDLIYNFLFETFLILWRNGRDIKSVRTVRLDVKCPVLLSDFNETNFLRRFSKNSYTPWISIEWSRVVLCGRTWRSRSVSCSSKLCTIHI